MLLWQALFIAKLFHQGLHTSHHLGSADVSLDGFSSV